MEKMEKPKGLLVEDCFSMEYYAESGGFTCFNIERYL